ncbi:MAG TPA: STM3941 family protein [Terriglobales bacterium]|nr:STM3941 family protein [Terriglobales bacterium]
MQTNKPILLRPKATQWLVVALGSLAFVLIGIWMVRSREMFGWLGIVFFGLCLSVSLICMLPKASYLRLTPDGFTICSLFRAHTICWEDVTGFGVGRVFTSRMVMFNYVESYQRSPKLRSFNTELTGFEAAIPDSYGLRHEDLADLLNRYKASSRRA